MTWTFNKSLASGWFWYREAVKNFNKPMPVWVFNPNGRLYPSFFAPHDDPSHYTWFVDDVSAKG